MIAGGTSPTDLLNTAHTLLRCGGPLKAELRSRAAALLGRQALERALEFFWAGRWAGMATCSMRSQLICLSVYVDNTIAAQASSAWASLSRACHHHPYELPPSIPQIEESLGVVDELIQVAGVEVEGARGRVTAVELG